MPRIRARVGTVEEPIEDKGKFCFEVILSFMGEGEGHKLGDWGPFDTEKEAKSEMRGVCEMISETITKKLTGQPSGKYIDLLTNELRDWKTN